jgi:hypothetical protein
VITSYIILLFSMNNMASYGDDVGNDVAFGVSAYIWYH